MVMPEKIVCGPDVERFVAKVKEVQKFGFDQIPIHNLGPEKEESLSFARDQLLPVLRRITISSSVAAPFVLLRTGVHHASSLQWNETRSRFGGPYRCPDPLPS